MSIRGHASIVLADALISIIFLKISKKNEFLPLLLFVEAALAWFSRLYLRLHTI